MRQGCPEKKPEAQAGAGKTWLAALALAILNVPGSATAQDSVLKPAPDVVSVPQAVLPLPGALNRVPVLNSNSPEVVQEEGILVSTLPPAGKALPEAHLNYLFAGRFDIFAHHIAKADEATQERTLYLGAVLYNPSSRKVVVDVLEAASYLSQPDAPFTELPPFIQNPQGEVYAGPGDRVSDTVLRGKRQAGWPAHFTVGPRSLYVLAALPIPVKGLVPPLNGRSLLCRLFAHGGLYAATLALYGHQAADGQSSAPTDKEWKEVLIGGLLAGPREAPASKPGMPGPFSYGRVAGVSRGDLWSGHVQVQSPEMVSYVVSSVEKTDLGTGQVQSARLLRREPGTAYAAHGNYAVEYKLSFALKNEALRARRYALLFQTPLHESDSRRGLLFYEHVAPGVFFRGTLKVSFPGTAEQQRYLHFVEHEGEPSPAPLAVVEVPPGKEAAVDVSFIYPPDATPPQVLTVSPTVP